MRHEPPQEDLEDAELHAKDDEGGQRSPREPPLRREEEGADHQKACRDDLLVSKSEQPLNARHIISCCRKVSAEINNGNDVVVNILLNNILVQRGLIAHEQR